MRDPAYGPVVHLLVLLFLYRGDSRRGGCGRCGSGGGNSSGGGCLREVGRRTDAVRRHPEGSSAVIGVTKNTGGKKHKQAVIHMLTRISSRSAQQEPITGRAEEQMLHIFSMVVCERS